MGIVIDTDVTSYLFKRDSRAELYRPHLSNFPYFISFMTLAEMRRWALEQNWSSAKRGELEEYLLIYLVVFADDDLCNFWAEAKNGAKRNGKPIDAADAWIAATALLLNVPLVTHNRTHFEGVEGLTVISETE